MEDTCNKCGAERDENSRFCMKCGTPYGSAEKKVEREEVSRSEDNEEEGLRKTKLNKKWRQINTWATLITGADGKQGMVANNVKKTLAEVAAPNLIVEHRHVRLAGLSGMFAGKRKQLVIENRALRGYHVFVSIEDYGKQLNVSWYLMLRENWLTRLLKLTAASAWAGFFLWPLVFIAKIFYASRGYTIPELMNMFDLEELTAYTTTVHHAVTAAVEGLMTQMNMDFSKVDTKSRGFLNIS